MGRQWAQLLFTESSVKCSGNVTHLALTARVVHPWHRHREAGDKTHITVCRS